MVARLSVAVDEQPGIARQHGRRVEGHRKRPGQRSGADIDGDMAQQFARVEAEGAERFGQPGAGVVADQQHRRPTRLVDQLDGRRLARPYQGRTGRADRGRLQHGAHYID